MPAYVALLRAINVGGAGKLAMADLKSLCVKLGYGDVRTYIASGNVVFASRHAATRIKAEMEAALADHVGKPVGLTVRTAADMVAIVDDNPFADAPGNRVAAIFLDSPARQAMLDGIKGQADDEAVALGHREIYVRYGQLGMGRSKLRIPGAEAGTARNMNTVAKLATMAASQEPSDR